MRPIDADAFDNVLSDAQDKCRRNGGNFRFGVLSTVRENLANAPTIQLDEPRVMTYDEMMKAEICFLEVKGIEEIYPFIRYEVDDKSYWSSPYTNNEDNPFEMLAEQEEYLLSVRCWTSRPTDEQRKAVEWE